MLPYVRRVKRSAGKYTSEHGLKEFERLCVDLYTKNLYSNQIETMTEKGRFLPFHLYFAERHFADEARSIQIH